MNFLLSLTRTVSIPKIFLVAPKLFISNSLVVDLSTSGCAPISCSLVFYCLFFLSFSLSLINDFIKKGNAFIFFTPQPNSLLILAPLVSLNGSPLLAGIKRLVTVNGMIVDWIVIIFRPTM